MKIDIKGLSSRELRELRNAVDERLIELSRVKNTARVSRPIDAHFQEWKGVNTPPALDRWQIATGRQYRLNARQVGWLREKFGMSPGSHVVVPYEIEFDLQGQALGFAATCCVGPHAKRGLRAFRIDDKDAELFYRLKDEPVKATKTTKTTQKEESLQARQKAMLEFLLQ